MAETTRHRNAFDLYWRLGADRSIERLHAELRAIGGAPTTRTLYEWSRQYRWQDRIAKLEQDARRTEDEARIQAVRDMTDRHAKEALLLQQKGAEWIAAIDGGDATAEAAIRAIVEGSRMERLARGEPTERGEVQGDVTVNARLAALSDAELDRLIEYVHGALGREDPASPG